MKKVKFKMSIKELSFEYEGDQETGQMIQEGIQRSLGSLVDTQNKVAAPELPSLTLEAHSVKPEATRTRASGPRRAKSSSVRTRIIALRADGFFKKLKPTAEIQNELAKRGHNFKSNHISAALLTLVKQEILQRQKNANDTYEYEEGPNNDFDRGTTEAG